MFAALAVSPEPPPNEARGKAEREVFNIVHRGKMGDFTDADLIAAGQDWGESAVSGEGRTPPLDGKPTCVNECSFCNGPLMHGAMVSDDLQHGICQRCVALASFKRDRGEALSPVLDALVHQEKDDDLTRSVESMDHPASVSTRPPTGKG